ncbi:MAG: AAA family ATPase [Patescibacteria group bacterium]|nr:AAA family ATPase [Patescibacteria group bacterium]
MKIEELKINGYRNFDSFVIDNLQPKGPVILAGQNGTGKSTILEITNFLLNILDINQLNKDIAQGITSSHAIWEITISISNDELNYLCKRIKILDSLRFQNENSVLEDLMTVIFKKGKRYYITRRVEIQPDNTPPNYEPVKNDWYLSMNNNNVPRPRSMELAMQNRLFCGYYKSLENVDLGGMNAFNPQQNDLGQIINSQDDIKNRSARTSVNIGVILNYLASKAVWNQIKELNLDLAELKNTLNDINKLINPLEIFYDETLVKENGEFNFTLKNLKSNKTYPLSFASSGEKQMIGLVGTLKHWKGSRIKPVLLFDEPDLNLHPDYVNRFSEFTASLLKDEKCGFTCMVATHSPDLIYWNPNNVYQISPDSRNLQKIDNLTKRVDLLKSLGKGFNLSYLIKKVIFVEGVDHSNNRVEDVEIYQKLVDKEKSEVVFIPAGIKSSRSGNKSGAISNQSIVEDIVNRLQTTEDLNIYALVDSDNEKTNKAKIIYTPFNCVENLFLFDAKIIEEVLKEKYNISEDINEKIKEIDPNFNGDKGKSDGKQIIKKLYNELIKNNHDVFKENGSFKGFQLLILDRLNINKFPKIVKDFLMSLRT